MTFHSVARTAGALAAVLLLAVSLNGFPHFHSHIVNSLPLSSALHWRYAHSHWMENSSHPLQLRLVLNQQRKQCFPSFHLPHHHHSLRQLPPSLQLSQAR